MHCARLRLSQFIMGILSVLVVACSGEPEASSPAGPNYLDSTFSEQRFRATVDSMLASGQVDEATAKRLKPFMGNYRKIIPADWTYQQIIDAEAQAMEMASRPVRMQVTEAWARNNQKMTEFRMELSFHNQLEVPIDLVRGHFQWVNAGGGVVWESPFFAVANPIAPGDSVGPLRLELAYSRPTGNELNDPKMSAMRDTLDKMLHLSDEDHQENFRFELKEVRVAGGQSPQEYVLKGPAESKGKSAMGLLKWASAHDDLISDVKKPFSRYYIEITPVLTSKVEATHGKYLLDDRVDKVRKFFTTQKKVPSAALSNYPGRGQVVLDDPVDFWGWPMQIRIWKGIERPS